MFLRILLGTYKLLELRRVGFLGESAVNCCILLKINKYAHVNDTDNLD
jgi:hypothetical protein